MRDSTYNGKCSSYKVINLRLVFKEEKICYYNFHTLKIKSLTSIESKNSGIERGKESVSPNIDLHDINARRR